MMYLMYFLIGLAVSFAFILVCAGSWVAVRWAWRQVRPTQPLDTDETKTPPPPYYKAHPWKMAGWVFLLILLAPIIVKVILPWGVTAYANAWTKPPSQWGTGDDPVQPRKPPGKSVGGPLRWSNNAKVKVRSRVNQEKLDQNRACFVGVIPPASWMDTTFVTYSEGVANWKAFLVDRTSMRNLPSSGVLNNRASLKERVRDVAMVHLPGLTNGREEKRLENTLPQSASRVVECYVQFDGGPTALHLDIKEPSDTFQYELEVGSEAVQIVGLPESFKWLWIAPVHHSCYQSRFFKTSILSSGISYKEAQTLVPHGKYPKLSSEVNLVGEGFEPSLPFQAIVLERDGVATVLSEAVLLQQSEVSGAPMSLRLNVPTSIKEVLTPAKIIVGVQL